MKLGIYKIALLAALILLGAFALAQQAAAKEKTTVKVDSVISCIDDGCGNCCYCACVRSPGYWMNHPKVWPIFCNTVGQTNAITLMKMPVKGNKILTIIPAYVAAMLNAAECGDKGPIWLILDYIWYDFLGCYVAEDLDPCSLKCLRANEPEWQCKGELYLSILEAYNNGELCSIVVY